MDPFRYVGQELDLFAEVRNWKAYWADQIRPFVRGDVLEVGAGIGANTELLAQGAGGRWLCLEPDAHLAAALHVKAGCETVCGTLDSVEGQRFDTIIYIDVLEHIEDDKDELRRAAGHLRPEGSLIVLSPAHQILRSPFDTALGHLRRYNRAMLRKISPAGTRLVLLRYLDSMGVAALTANALILRQSLPRQWELRLWDRCMVPVSRVLDKLLVYSFGKSIVAVWQKL